MLVSFFFASLALYAYATPGPIPNPVQSGQLENVLEGIVRFVIRVGIPVLVFFVILTGLMFVLAQGNEQKLQQARTMFYWVLLGGGIILGSATIAQMVINFAKQL